MMALECLKYWLEFCWTLFLFLPLVLLALVAIVLAFAPCAYLLDEYVVPRMTNIRRKWRSK